MFYISLGKFEIFSKTYLDIVVGIAVDNVDLVDSHDVVGILDIVDVPHMDSFPVADHTQVAYSLDARDNRLFELD